MRADVVVVGAGLAGCALSYYLSAEDVDVVLIDKDYPGLGATGRSAGIVTVQHWNSLDVSLARESQDILRDILGNQGFQRPGFLRATSREEDVELMEERVRAYRREGIEAEILSSEEMAERFPSIEVQDLMAGVCTPDDGYVDAYDATAAFASGARERGASLTMRTRVQGVRVRSSGVVVEMEGGMLEATVVVVAAGARTRQLVRTVGVDIPLKPYRTQALVTAPVEAPSCIPMFHEIPEGRYLRPDREGVLMGNGTEHEEADPGSYSTHADFEFHSQMASWISRRVPSLRDARISRGWAGLCVATPDRMPLVGEVEGVEGLFVLAGFNGMGVMRGPPLARHLAETLLGHPPSFDLAPFHPARFEEGMDFSIREGFSLQ